MLIGGITLLVGYRIVRRVYAEEPGLALGTAAFMAFLPMHLAMNAGVNNDPSAELMLALVVWRLVAIGAAGRPMVGPGPGGTVGLGVLLGLALLTKMQAYVAVGVALLRWVGMCWRLGRSAAAGMLLDGKPTSRRARRGRPWLAWGSCWASRAGDLAVAGAQYAALRPGRPLGDGAPRPGGGGAAHGAAVRRSSMAQRGGARPGGDDVSQFLGAIRVDGRARCPSASTPRWRG